MGGILELLIILLGAILTLDGCGPSNKEKKDTDIEEANKDKIKEAIDEEEEGEDEACSCDACVTCSKVPEGTPYVHIVKKDGTVVVNDIEELTRTDIKLEQCFEGCTAETVPNSQCSVTEEDIEEGSWQNVDEDRSEDGVETLKQTSSYMICTKGFGLIYFVNSGQELRSSWDILEKYVNGDVIKRLDPEWDFVTFYELYEPNAFEQMRKYLFEYNVTDPVSVMMFLCTLSEECGHGTRKKERGDNEYFHDHGYDETVCGSGIIQLTSDTQQAFLEYLLNNKNLPEKDLKKIADISEGYKEGVTEAGKTYIFNVENPTKYIYENYPIESAVWFWSTNITVSIEGIGPESADDFVVRHKEDNLYNTFACSQMFVNSKPYRAGSYVYDEICECSANCQINLVSNCPKPEESSEHREHDYCFYLEEKNRHSFGPNGWETRESCWETGEQILRENGDI